MAERAPVKRARNDIDRRYEEWFTLRCGPRFWMYQAAQHYRAALAVRRAAGSRVPRTIRRRLVYGRVPHLLLGFCYENLLKGWWFQLHASGETAVLPKEVKTHDLHELAAVVLKAAGIDVADQKPEPPVWLQKLPALSRIVAGEGRYPVPTAARHMPPPEMDVSADNWQDFDCLVDGIAYLVGHIAPWEPLAGPLFGEEPPPAPNGIARFL